MSKDHANHAAKKIPISLSLTEDKNPPMKDIPLKSGFFRAANSKRFS